MLESQYSVWLLTFLYLNLHSAYLQMLGAGAGSVTDFRVALAVYTPRQWASSPSGGAVGMC